MLEHSIQMSTSDGFQQLDFVSLSSCIFSSFRHKLLVLSLNLCKFCGWLINRFLVPRQIRVVGRIDEVVREGPIHILRRHRLPFRVRARADDRVGRRVEVVHEVLEGKMRLHTRAVL